MNHIFLPTITCSGEKGKPFVSGFIWPVCHPSEGPPVRHDPPRDQRAAGQTGLLQEDHGQRGGARRVPLLSRQRQPVQRRGHLNPRHRDHLPRAPDGGPAHWPLTHQLLGCKEKGKRKENGSLYPHCPSAAPWPAGWLAGWPRGRRTAASRSWISVHVRIETEASAEGLLKVWLCTYHSCYLTFIFYSNNNLRVHSVSAKTKKKTTKPSGMKCCLFYFVSWFIVCLWFSAAVKCSCVSYCFLPIVKLNEAQG